MSGAAAQLAALALLALPGAAPALPSGRYRCSAKGRPSPGDACRGFSFGNWNNWSLTNGLRICQLGIEEDQTVTGQDCQAGQAGRDRVLFRRRLPGSSCIITIDSLELKQPSHATGERDPLQCMDNPAGSALQVWRTAAPLNPDQHHHHHFRGHVQGIATAIPT